MSQDKGEVCFSFTHQHEDGPVLTSPTPILSRMGRVVRKVRLSEFKIVMPKSSGETHVNAPSERRNTSANDRVLVDGNNFSILEDAEGFFCHGRKLHIVA